MNRKSYFVAFILSLMVLVLPMRDAPGYVPESNNTLVKNLDTSTTVNERPEQFKRTPAVINSSENPDDQKKHWVRVAHLGHNKTNKVPGTKHLRCSYHHPEDTVGDTICLEVTHTDLDCSENACNHQYDNCALEIDYTLTSDKQDDVSIETSVTCIAEIVYLTKHGHILRSGSYSETEHLSFKAQSGDSFSISLDFPFSFYEGVVRARLNSLECHLNGEYHH